jgi:iron complex transport system ATP-binding protein
MTVIEFKNVNFGYTEDRIVLHDVNLVMDKPGLYCILGPNGVGKSTIVKCINKINEPLSGDVFLDGENLKDMELKEISQKVTFVPAHQTDAFSMSVLDTILVGRYNKSKWGSKKSDIKKVYETMKLLHIEDLAYRKYNELSAGQHQKVTIARGVVQETPVLILDEPTANLDVQYQIYVTEMLRAIAEKRGMIILMISHDLNITSKYAHYVIMLARPGYIYAYGKPEEILTTETIEKVYSVKSRIVQDKVCSEDKGTSIEVSHIFLDEAIMTEETQ